MKNSHKTEVITETVESRMNGIFIENHIKILLLIVLHI